jgi:hypothetical protein
MWRAVLASSESCGVRRSRYSRVAASSRGSVVAWQRRRAGGVVALAASSRWRAVALVVRRTVVL